MTPFRAQLPNDIRSRLQQITNYTYDDVDVRVETINLASRVAVPFSMALRSSGRMRAHAEWNGAGNYRSSSPGVWTGMRRVTGRSRPKNNAGGLKVVGATIGETIYIDPDYAEWHTAAGLALLAHERLHLDQVRNIPDFSYHYAMADAQTPANRPWENPYEYDAYLLECQVWHSLIQSGMPEGSWVPLGAAVGLCDASGGLGLAA